MSDTLEHVVADGVQFLQSLTAHYGAEKGMEVWEAMSAAVGNEVKGKVFFAMLTGAGGGKRVKFTTGNPTFAVNGAVACIKAMRSATRMLDLKAAKDLYDQSKTGYVTCTADSPEQARMLIRDLRDLGCVIS
jgi:ribosomal protein L7/L12